MRAVLDLSIPKLPAGSAVRSGAAALLLAWMPLAATAATIEVAPGFTIIANDGQCSLTEAINNANADAQANNADCVAGSGGDVLLLAPGTTYVLLAPLPAVASSIVVEGNQSIIQRSDAVACTINTTMEPGEFRLFSMTSGGLALRDLTLRYGCADGTVATNSGAAVYATGGALALERVLVEENMARGVGAVYADNAVVDIEDSILRDNYSMGGGGAIYNRGGSTTTIIGSTIHGNLARGSGGGGILNFATVTIVNSTVSGNVSVPTNEFSGGGGIATNVGLLSLVNVTLVDNGDESTIGFGAGILIQGPLSVRNSIIANNFPGDDCSGFVLDGEGENLDSDGSCFALDMDNFTTVTPMALALGPLQDNGGPTPTHLPGPASAAIDAVATCTYLAAPLTVDQRGVSRPQFSACDLGAVERGPLPDGIFADGFEAAVIE